MATWDWREWVGQSPDTPLVHELWWSRREAWCKRRTTHRSSWRRQSWAVTRKFDWRKYRALAVLSGLLSDAPVYGKMRHSRAKAKPCALPLISCCESNTFCYPKKSADGFSLLNQSSSHKYNFEILKKNITWVFRNKYCTEMRILRWKMDVSLCRTQVGRDDTESWIGMHDGEVRLRWYGHIIVKEEENPIKIQDFLLFSKAMNQPV